MHVYERVFIVGFHVFLCACICDRFTCMSMRALMAMRGVCTHMRMNISKQAYISSLCLLLNEDTYAFSASVLI